MYVTVTRYVTQSTNNKRLISLELISLILINNYFSAEYGLPLAFSDVSILNLSKEILENHSP